MASLRDELFRIAKQGSKEEMRKLLQDPEVNVNQTHLSQLLVPLHQSAEFNPDTGVTKVQSSMQKFKAR
jgi:arginine repressor